VRLLVAVVKVYADPSRALTAEVADAGRAAEGWEIGHLGFSLS